MFLADGRKAPGLEVRVEPPVLQRGDIHLSDTGSSSQLTGTHTLLLAHPRIASPKTRRSYSC
jgi:hypothetical protein